MIGSRKFLINLMKATIAFGIVSVPAVIAFFTARHAEGYDMTRTIVATAITFVATLLLVWAGVETGNSDEILGWD